MSPVDDALEFVASVFDRWVEFSPSMKLQNRVIGLKMSQEPESTKWRGVNG